MGTYRLEKLDTGDFLKWINRIGYKDEYNFWSSLSGIPQGTVTDHMVQYLGKLGYTGSPNTQFRQFLQDQAAAAGNTNRSTLYDLASFLYDDGFHTSGGTVAVQLDNTETTDLANTDGVLIFNTGT